MRRKVILPLVLLIGLVFISTESFAGWTQAKGHSYHQLTASYYDSKNLYSTVEGGKGKHDVIKKVPSAKFE